MKRTMILLSLILTLISACCAVHAEELETPEDDPVNTDYQTISQFVATLSISGNTADCVGIVQLKDSYTGELTVMLQRQTSGNNWTTVATWSGHVSVGVPKKVEGTFTLSVHGTYRVKANLVSGSENEDTFSQTRTY